MSLRWLVRMLPVLALASCQRKLPGPAECQHFAEVVIGASRDDPRLTLPAARRLEDLTTQCLTTPYDYQLLRCVEGSGLVQSCLAAFNQRNGRRLAKP